MFGLNAELFLVLGNIQGFFAGIYALIGEEPALTYFNVRLWGPGWGWVGFLVLFAEWEKTLQLLGLICIGQVKDSSSSTQVNEVCLTFEHKFRHDKRPWKHD